MTRQWVVIQRSGDRDDDVYVYGPLYTEETATHFADFITSEVDPARPYRLDSPVMELLTFWNRTTTKAKQAGEERPDMWPPMPGHVWQDRAGNRWICLPMPTGKPYLTCLAKQSDDSAEEIWRLYGPLTFLSRITPNDEEPPF